MNIRTEARRDAHEFARAQMFYGEGAGVRRKLISATVDAKCDKDPEYERAFGEALDEEDMAEHAEKARKERRRRDVSESLSKNAKGLATGNHQSVQTSVLVLVTAVYVAHQTGYDKKIYEEGKWLLDKAKTRFNRWRYKNAPNSIY